MFLPDFRRNPLPNGQGSSELTNPDRKEGDASPLLDVDGDRVAYRRIDTGIRDTGILDNRAFNLYGYTLALNGAKTVKSITLPNTRNVTVLAITLSPAVAAAPDFTLSATPPALSVVQGGSGTSQIAVSAQNGFAGAVTFTVSRLPEQQHLHHPTLEDSGAALNPAISLNFLFPCPIRFG